MSGAGSDKTQIWLFLNLTNCQGWTRLLSERKAIRHNSVWSMLIFPSWAKLLFSREHWPVEHYEMCTIGLVLCVQGYRDDNILPPVSVIVQLLRDKVPTQRHSELGTSIVVKNVLLSWLPCLLNFAIHCSSSSRHRTMRRKLCFPCAEQSSRVDGRKESWGCSFKETTRSPAGWGKSMNWTDSAATPGGKLQDHRKETDISQYIILLFSNK